MKICRYGNGEAGLIEGDSIYPLGNALAATGMVREGASMAEIVDALANQPGAAAGVSKLAAGDYLKGTIDGIGTMELNVGAEQ